MINSTYPVPNDPKLSTNKKDLIGEQTEMLKRCYENKHQIAKDMIKEHPTATSIASQELVYTAGAVATGGAGPVSAFVGGAAITAGTTIVDEKVDIREKIIEGEVGTTITNSQKANYSAQAGKGAAKVIKEGLNKAEEVLEKVFKPDPNDPMHNTSYYKTFGPR